jgi:hypothetical protein
MFRRAFLSAVGALALAPLVKLSAKEPEKFPVNCEGSGKPLRRIERWDGTQGEWVRVRMRELKVGNCIRTNDWPDKWRVVEEAAYDPSVKEYACQVQTWTDEPQEGLPC